MQSISFIRLINEFRFECTKLKSPQSLIFCFADENSWSSYTSTTTTPESGNTRDSNDLVNKSKFLSLYYKN